MPKITLPPSAITLIPLLVPAQAWASLHLDSGWDGLYLTLRPAMSLGVIALLAAALLFFKRRRYGWLLACTLLAISDILLFRLIPLTGNSGVMLFSVFGMFWFPVAYWIFLGIAVFKKAPDRDDAVEA